MHCCRCNLRLDSGHDTGGGIYLFADEHFCHPCLINDALWKKDIQFRLDDNAQKIAASPIMRRFLEKHMGVPTAAKIEAFCLKRCKIPVMQVWTV